MSNNPKDYTGEILASAVLVGALALLVAAFKLGSHLVASWIIITFQILLTATGVVLSGVFTWWVAESLFQRIAKQVQELERSHRELITQMKRRIPAFIATALVVTEATMLIAGTAFKGETLPTLVVSLFLLLLFWIANEFMTAQSRCRRYIGVTLWFFALLLLPVAVFIHRKGDWSALSAEIQNIPLGYLLALILSAVLLFALPFAFQTHDDAA